MPARSLHSLGVCRIIISSANKKQIGIGVPSYTALCAAPCRGIFVQANLPYGWIVRGIERCAGSVYPVRQPVRSAHPQLALSWAGSRLVHGGLL